MNPEVIWTNDSRWNAGVVYKTSDGGQTWAPVATKQNVGQNESDPARRALLSAFAVHTAMPAGAALSGLDADPTDVDAAYGFGSEFILRTTDGGKKWQDVTSTRPDPAKTENWRGTGYTGWCSTNIAFNPYKPGQSIFQAMDAARAWVSDDDLTSWRYASGDPVPWLGGTDVTFAKDGHVYATCGQHGEFNGILRSVDSGATWKVLAGAAHGLPDAGFGKHPEANGLYVHPDDGKHVWVIVGGKLHASTDAGEKWSPVDGAPAGANWIAADPTTPRQFYVSSKSGVFVTTDGMSFTNTGGPRPGGRGRINCDARGNVYATQWRDGTPGVWRYAPATKRWTRLLDEVYAFEVNADPSDPNRLALVTNDDPYHDHTNATGVWLSSDAGASWTQAVDGLPMLRGQAVAFDPHTPGRLVVGTFGRGFFITTWPMDQKLTGTRRYAATDADATSAAITKPTPDAPAPAAAQSTLLKNGDMSAGDALPAGWDGRFGDVDATRDATVFRKAPASLSVKPSKAGASGQAFQSIEGHAGETFKLSGFVKSAGAVKVNVAIQSFDAEWSKNDFQQVKYVQNDTDWSDFSKEVSIPSWAARFNVVLLVEGDGHGWLDEVKLMPVVDVPAGAPRTELVLVNPSFEQGTDAPWGWNDRFGELTIARDAVTFHSGPASLRIETKGKLGQVSQRVDADAGTTFTISGAVKSEGNVKVNFAVQSFAAGQTHLKFGAR